MLLHDVRLEHHASEGLLDPARRREVSVAGERSDEQPDDMELAMHRRDGGRREPLPAHVALRPW